MKNQILSTVLTVVIVIGSFFLGLKAGLHKPITVEIVNAKPEWWGYNYNTRLLTVGLGNNTNPSNNSSYTFAP